MDGKVGKAGPKLPQEIINQIINDVLRGGRYSITDPEAYFRFSPGVFHGVISNYHPPAYAGLLLASKETSKEVQRTLYSEGRFEAYFCSRSDCKAPILLPEVYGRIQRLEIFLELKSHYDSNTTRTEREVYYRRWFEIFGGSEVDRESCRIIITQLVFRTRAWRHANVQNSLLFQQIVEACKNFVGFEFVTLELQEAPYPLGPRLQESPRVATTGPLKDPAFADHRLQALKAHLQTELTPSLGPCIYYDRDDFHCMEFRPRVTDNENRIQPGDPPFVLGTQYDYSVRP